MRLIGVAERALETLCQRALSRHAFGRNIADHGVIRQWIADSVGNKGARAEIAMIKVVAPNMAQSPLSDEDTKC
jgi:acyl-CoA dehydrogenase